MPILIKASLVTAAQFSFFQTKLELLNHCCLTCKIIFILTQKVYFKAKLNIFPNFMLCWWVPICTSKSKFSFVMPMKIWENYPPNRFL